MSTYNVNAGGNAPEDAKSGDYIVTGGGTYQVLDGSKYSGMNSDALKAAGVSYNPVSKLYSTKVNAIKPTDVNIMGKSDLDSWLQSSDKASKAQLDSAYQTNVSKLGQAYNTNKGDLTNQIDDTKATYLNNILENKEEAYTNAKNALYGAESRGMMNSAQGQAMTNASLWDSSKQTSDLTRERDTLVNGVKTNINTLSQNYNLGLTELEKAKLSDEIDALSTNKLNYLSQMMNLDNYNSEAMNTALQNQKDRDLTSSEAQKDRDMQMLMASMSGSGSSGGGGGYSSYGSGSKKSTADTADGTISSTQSLLDYVVEKYPNMADQLNSRYDAVNVGVQSEADFVKYLKSLAYGYEYKKSGTPDIISSLMGKKKDTPKKTYSYYETR